MRVPSALLQLARLFIGHAPLYLVGGTVRDALIGIRSDDLDIAACLSTEQVKEILAGSPYKICAEFPRTGTLVIVGKGIKCEYTTFRTDSYPNGRGNHAPSEVQFTEDINLDAYRRDFTCNAVYYDIVNNSYIDPTQGIKDIRDKTIRTTRHPREVLSEDALRIMRLPRIATEIGFHVEPNTMISAAEFAPLLKDIAPERIQAELVKIIATREKYPDFQGFKPSYGISLLNDLGVSKMIFDEPIPFSTLMTMDNLKESGFYKCTLSTYIVLIFLDKELCALQNFLVKYKFSKELSRDILATSEGYLKAVNLSSQGNNYKEIKFFCVKYYPYLSQIIALMMAKEIDCAKIMEGLHIVGNLSLPLNVTSLAVGGRDLLNRGISGVAIGEILNRLYYDCIDLELSSKEEQLMQLEKILIRIGGNDEHC